MIAAESVAVARIRTALACHKPGCSCHRSANVHCPVHLDADPSLTVHEGADGKILVNCKAGCTQEAVVAKLKEMKLWPESNTEPEERAYHSSSHPVAIYEYRTWAGELVAIKGRFEAGDGRKSFRWKLPGASTWSGLDGKPLNEIPLWGSELLAAAPPEEVIFVVEGEKAATACRAQGLTAVSHPGGASTADFGNSLEVLKGRHVVLWPDNDEAGRRFMARMHAALKPLARSVNLVQPPVPEKGDAVEYFGRGGTVADLMRDAPPTEPVVDYLAHDAVRVRIPSAMGTISFTFTSMEKSNRELQSELEVALGDGEPYPTRLNLLSNSQVTDVRRTLELVFPKDLHWPRIMAQAITKAVRAYLQQDRGIRHSSIQEEAELRFLIRPLLQEGAANVWFGAGSSLKTYVALLAAVAVAEGQRSILNMAVRKAGGVMLVDYENQPADFKRRLHRIFTGLGYDEDPDLPLYHWLAHGIPLVDQIDAIRAKVEKEGITLVIIDSAAAACGGKPEDADVTLNYFRALSKLGPEVTTLTIAHVSKNSDEGNPFGSIFWTNQPRRTILFSRTSDEDTDDIDIGIFCKKVNEGKKPRPTAIHVRFEGEDGPVTFTSTSIAAVPELSSRRPLKAQIWDVLTQPMTLIEIKELLAGDVSVDTVAATVRKEKAMFVRVDGEETVGRGTQTRWARCYKGE